MSAFLQRDTFQASSQGEPTQDIGGDQGNEVDLTHCNYRRANGLTLT